MTTKQIPRHPDDPAPITDLVREDIYHHLDAPSSLVPRMVETAHKQHDKGLKRYGKVLTRATAADMAVYACEEACDLAMYARCRADQTEGDTYQDWSLLYRRALHLWRDVEALAAEEGTAESNDGP